MDTYENEERNDQPQEEQTEQPETAEISDGFYHGNGAGVTESTAAAEQAQEQTEQENVHAEQTPTQPSPQEEPKPKKSGKRIWITVAKSAAAVVTAFALVVSGCAISVGFMNRYWKTQNENLAQSFEERLDVLKKQLDDYENGKYTVVTVTQEGQTPSQIYQNNLDAVVEISCTVKTSSGVGTSAGSGFAWQSDGYIVTNHHVIENASAITVTFADGKAMSATLVGSDSTNDIALLKVDATDLQCVELGSVADLAVGEQVVAIGNALGELSFSLSVGHVSGVDRSITTDGTELNMIQTDVAINSGNSGGPLFNSRGQVVGITSAKYSGSTSSGASIEGISFAIPVDDVLGMLEDLREFGYIRSAYMGITCYTAEMSDGTQLGVCVKTVEKGSAYRAGIQVGDIITQIGGYEIKNKTDLTKALRQLEIGTEYTVTVYRPRKGELTLKITLEEKPQQ